LVGFGFLAIGSQWADGNEGIFFKEFNSPTAIRRLAADSLV
jgi:hypothetical protein